MEPNQLPSSTFKYKCICDGNNSKKEPCKHWINNKCALNGWFSKKERCDFWGQVYTFLR